MVQAKALQDTFGSHRVIHLEADDETIINRLTKRITCGCCGAVFNELFSPPKIESVCDNCNGELIKRTDDTIEVALERLKTYHLETEPLIDLYRRQLLLTTIPTDNFSPDEIFSRVMEEIKPATIHSN